MPSRYAPKATGPTRGRWTEGALQSAAAAIMDQRLTPKDASEIYDIPLTTLRRRVRAGDLEKRSLGPPSILGPNKERNMVRRIMELQNAGFAPTGANVREMAFRYAEQLGIQHTFNIRRRKAGRDWLAAFLRRHPELSVRKAEGVSVARSRGMNRSDVTSYFGLLRNLLVEKDLLNKPERLFNVDESGLQLNNVPGHVIAAKGSKNVARITSHERGETVTLICCCNAAGTFLPPACILKGKRKNPLFEEGMPLGSAVYMSQKSAYVNMSIFLEWLKNHFVPRKPEGPVLLLLDGHTSHCNSVEVLEFAAANDVTLFCLPSHTTQFLQPLDRAFFRSLKGHYRTACNSFMQSNPTTRINRTSFGSLLNEAWTKSARADVSASAFRATGIYPFDPSAIPANAFINERNVSDGQEPTVERPTSVGSISPIWPIPSTSNIAQLRRKQLAEVLTSTTSMATKVRAQDRKHKKRSAKSVKAPPSTTKRSDRSRYRRGADGYLYDDYHYADPIDW